MTDSKGQEWLAVKRKIAGARRTNLEPPQLERAPVEAADGDYSRRRRRRGRDRGNHDMLRPHELMPIPASASERTVRTRALLCRAFARADMRAECPAGHRLAVTATSGARKRLCMHCRGRISAVFVTCADGRFAACIRCTLGVAEASAQPP